MLQLDLSKVGSFLPEGFFAEREQALSTAHEMLRKGNGPGGEYTGWVSLPANYDKVEFERIKGAAKKIQADSQVLLVVGIGGSYLGARAMIELLRSPNYNLMRKNTPDVFFVGNTLDTDTVLETMALIGDRDFSINVISKSGTTTEPAIGFRIFKNLLEAKYGKQAAAKRIYATTDKCRGALKKLADTEGYETFVVPDDVGGRYSVLTAVGLLPLAVAGIDIDGLMYGANCAMEKLAVPGPDNAAWKYAAARHALHQAGKKIEVLVSYEPGFRCFAEWWKQLYGESEGKNGKGLFPANVEFSADLHSVGQYIQDGQRTLFETVVCFEHARGKMLIPTDRDDVDGLNYLAGKSLEFVARQALRGAVLAHVDGGVPNIMISLPSISAESVGWLIYFFEYACGLSGYLLGVDPFDQPGVEAYKKNMFALLGKPGYEERKAQLETRL